MAGFRFRAALRIRCLSSCQFQISTAPSCYPIPLATHLSTMPPKEKSKASGSTEKKSAPKSAAAKPVEEEVAATKEGRISKPDQATYQAEQDRLKKEIDEVTAKFVCPAIYLPAKSLLTSYAPQW